MPIVRLSVHQWPTSLSTCMYIKLPYGEGRTMHTLCIEVVLWIISPWLTIIVLMFFMGRTHHHYKLVNDPLETMGLITLSDPSPTQ